MLSDQNISPSESLLTRQLHLLGVSDIPDELDEEKKQELRRWENLTLPPLHLPKQSSNRNLISLSFMGSILAAAAALIFVLWPTSSTQHFSLKGKSQVWVYWERGGVINMWQQGAGLTAGDRVRSEVLAGYEADVLTIILGRSGEVLSGLDHLSSHIIPLKTGERAALPGSFALDENNEGESLQVLLCRRGVLGEIISKVDKGAQIVDSQTCRTLEPSGCECFNFVLRE